MYVCIKVPMCLYYVDNDDSKNRKWTDTLSLFMNHRYFNISE